MLRKPLVISCYGVAQLIMETCNVVLTFESVNDFARYHFFFNIHKMKFGIFFLNFDIWPSLE